MIESCKMMFRRYKLGTIWISSACFIIALVSVITYRTERRVVHLPSGEVLRFGGVSYGTNVFVEGNLIERILTRHLPASGIRFFGLKLNPAMTYMPGPFETTPVITAWFRVRASGSVTSFLSDLRGWRFVAGSRSGRQLDSYPALIKGQFSNEVVFAISLNAFPRDQKDIFLTVVPPGIPDSELPRFRIRNPVPVTVPDWRSTSLPATNRHGGLVLVLERAQVNEGIFGESRIPLNAEVGFRVHAEDVTLSRLDADRVSRQFPAPWEVVQCEQAK